MANIHRKPTRRAYGILREGARYTGKFHLEKGSPYMNVLMNKLERIRELSVEMKSDIDSINVDIESVERHLQEYCPINHCYQIDETTRMIWDGRNLLLSMHGHKGSKRLIDCHWKIKVTYYHKIEEMLDKITDQIKTLTMAKR